MGNCSVSSINIFFSLVGLLNFGCILADFGVFGELFCILGLLNFAISEKILLHRIFMISGVAEFCKLSEDIYVSC